MASTTAARRYAKAFFELCMDRQVVDAVRTDLDGLVDLMRRSPDWEMFVTSPTGALDKRAKVITALLEDKVHPLTRQFIAFLDSKRRLPLLAPIRQEWMVLFNAARENLPATAVSAHPLDPAQVDELTRRLSKRYGKHVILTTRVDESIIGGMKVHVGDNVLDFSVETQLQRLKSRMIYA